MGRDFVSEVDWKKVDFGGSFDSNFVSKGFAHIVGLGLASTGADLVGFEVARMGDFDDLELVDFEAVLVNLWLVQAKFELVLVDFESVPVNFGLSRVDFESNLIDSDSILIKLDWIQLSTGFDRLDSM